MKDILRHTIKGQTEYYYDDENRLVCKINHCIKNQGSYHADRIIEYWYYYDEYGELIDKKKVTYSRNISNNITSLALYDRHYEDLLYNTPYNDSRLIYKDLLSDTISKAIVNMDVSDRNKDIFRRYYGIGYPRTYTQSELAVMYNITTGRVWDIIRRCNRHFIKTRNLWIDFMEEDNF